MLFSWLEYIFTSCIVRDIILRLFLLNGIKAFYTLTFISYRKLISNTVTSVCFTTCYTIIDTRRLGDRICGLEIIWYICIFYCWNRLPLGKIGLRKFAFLCFRKSLNRFCWILSLNPLFNLIILLIIIWINGLYSFFKLFILLLGIWIDTFHLRRLHFGCKLLHWFLLRFI